MKQKYLSFKNPYSAPKLTSRRLGAAPFRAAAYASDAPADPPPADPDITTAEGLLKHLNATKTSLEKKAKEDAKAEVTAQLKEITDRLDILKGMKEADLTVEKIKGMYDDLQITMKAFERFQIAMKSTPVGPVAPKTFGSELGQKLLAREKELKQFKQDKKGFGTLEIESKAVGNMGSSANLTGSYFVQPTVVPGVQLKMYETVHMRNILPTGSTNSNVVRYVRDNGGEGGPAMVAEAGTKPQIDRDLEILDANVRKIATYFRVPEEMIDDIPYLQSFLVEIGIEEVMIVEDDQILYGDGTGQNLSGLFTNATAFSAGGSSVNTPNNFDVLLAAKKQGRLLKTNPTVAMVSPEDFFDMITTKDDNKNYLFLGGGNGIEVQGILRGRGLPTIVEHTSVEQGDFLIIDPRNAAIFDRTGTSVRFYDQDQDNAIKNLITIVIEKRLALPIFRTDGIIKGTFEAAKTALAAA